MPETKRGIKIKFNGKTYYTGIPYLEVNNQYIAHIDGYRIFINVTLERPEVCGEIEIVDEYVKRKIIGENE